MAYIELDRISNEAMGLKLERARPFISPKRTRGYTSIPGSLLSVEPIDWDYAPTPIHIALLAKGATRAEVEEVFRAAAPWFLKAAELRLSSDPDRYYLGSIQEVGDEVEMIANRWGRLEMMFMCNPPCWHRVLTGVQGLRLNLNTRIPEKITAANRTCQGFFSGAGALPQVIYTASHPADLYFKITGTFSQLALGGGSGLVVNYETPQSMDVYIDCVTGWVYHKLGGVLTAIPYSGDFPVLSSTGQIAVDGDALNCTIYMLAIERG